MTRAAAKTPGRYAEGTKVSVEKSLLEISQTIRRFGARDFSTGERGGRPFVMFAVGERVIRFELPDASHTARLPARYRGSVVDARAKAIEDEKRRLCRALAMAVKSKLEIIESGISDVETELLPYTVRADGETIGDYVRATPEFFAAITGHEQLALPMSSGTTDDR